MYSLIISGAKGRWDENNLSMDRQRVFEHTDSSIVKFFQNSGDAYRTLGRYPALLGYERGAAPFRLAMLDNIEVAGNFVTFNRTWITGMQEIDPDLVYGNPNELGIVDVEQYRTHWAVKDVDLAAALEAVGALSPAARNTLIRRMRAHNKANRIEPPAGIMAGNGSLGSAIRGTVPIGAALASTIQDAPRTWAALQKPAAADPPHQRILVQGINAALVVPPVRPKVFIVHGRDNSLKSEVARFVDRIGLEPIILHEQPNRGRTILEKFEETSADIAFALVLITPDDIGGLKGDGKMRERARQNVILELGYFLGRFTRSKVCALVKGSPELPSDVLAVTYVSADTESWKLEVARELAAASVPFNPEALY